MSVPWGVAATVHMKLFFFNWLGNCSLLSLKWKYLTPFSHFWSNSRSVLSFFPGWAHMMSDQFHSGSRINSIVVVTLVKESPLQTSMARVHVIGVSYEGLWFCLQTAVVVTSDQHQSGCHWATSLCSESFLHPCSTPTLPAKAPAVIALRRVHQHRMVQNCGYSLYLFQFFSFSFSSLPSSRLHYGHVVASSLMWTKRTSFYFRMARMEPIYPVLVFSPSLPFPQVGCTMVMWLLPP